MRLDIDDEDSKYEHSKESEEEQEKNHHVTCLGPIAHKKKKKKSKHVRTTSKLRCNGEEFLQNYLIKLFYENKISAQLFDLLHNHMLLFDAGKRSTVRQIMKHSWFMHE